MKIVKSFLIAFILSILTLPLFIAPVHATAISNPDSAPTITSVSIHTSLVESGDMCITGIYNIPYATLPTTVVDSAWTADKAFIIRLIHTDGVTELGTITPYTYFTSNGYNQGAFLFYFPAATAPTWGADYIIRVSENPALFTTSLSWDTTISTSAYAAILTQSYNQADLADKVITISGTLEGAYSVDLLSTSGGRTVLSTTGENYYRGAMYGLQAMAPSLFFLQSAPIDYTATTWSTGTFDAYATRFTGTWVGTAQAATATQFGLPEQVLMSIPIIVLCLLAVIFSSLLVKKIEPGWVLACLFAILGALLGWIPMALFAVIYQTMAIYVSWIWLGSKGKWMGFLAVNWFASTLICLILEGAFFGTSQNSVINDLSVITSINVGDILGLATSSLTFFRGIVRVFVCDYSFYVGMWKVFQYFWIIALAPEMIYDIIKSLSQIYAGFLPRL